MMVKEGKMRRLSSQSVGRSIVVVVVARSNKHLESNVLCALSPLFFLQTLKVKKL